MKKIISLVVFLAFASFSSFAYDSHTTFAASLGFGSENGEINNVSTSASLGNFGVFIGAGIFPDFNNVGFHVDMDLHFANWASGNEGGIGTASLDGSKSFSLAYQVGLGPSFKKETDDILLQFTPEIGIAWEMEKGNVSYTSRSYYYSYTYSFDYLYTGFLFGFGGDLSLAIKPTNKLSFAMGTHLAYYPVYKPSITVGTDSGKVSYDIKLDSYSRFLMNIYLGVQLHLHK